MANNHDLPSDSDDSDEDYVPDKTDNEVLSEVDDESDNETGPEDENDGDIKESGKRGAKGKKRKKSGNGKRKKLKKGSNSPDISEEKDNQETEGETQLTEEEEKKRADSLWADFMKDTSMPARPKSTSSVSTSKETPMPSDIKPKTETVKVTKVFEFAGEEVRVEKEVPADCAEARLLLPSSKDRPTSTSTVSKPNPRGLNTRRAGLGGISSVLGQLGKKAKISTLEKSKLDWDSYKKQENIEEEIVTHNKGKDGYLERQDFLVRADLRQFDIEKELRNSRRTKR